MTHNEAADDESAAAFDAKAMARAAWAQGDYHRFATATVWEVGAVLVEACKIGPGQRVLDVAAGTGNTAIRAALAGASVVASDLTPENFDSGRRAAREHGVELEWVEADAEALPFADAEFDAVTSSFGAMFPPDQEAVARELCRVCRPGGTIGLASFTPEGLAGDFFGLVEPYVPDARAPLGWGDEERVRELFRGCVRALNTERRSYVERAADPGAYQAFFQETFGPVVALRGALAEPERAAFDDVFSEFADRANEGSPGGPAEYTYEYLLVVAER